MAPENFAIGVDLGGTKLVVALIDSLGRVSKLLRYATAVQDGPAAIGAQIASAIAELRKEAASDILAVGIGVAGQVEANTGLVRFAPNLGWHNVPLQSDLIEATGLPVVVTNDVRAATWGEWLWGAGKGCDNLVCIFVGTGIGGGIVSNGRLIAGCSNAAGEIGHMTVDMNGPVCHCGKRGCFEALAGGWAIAKRVQEAVSVHPKQGATLLNLAGGIKEKITAKIVGKALRAGDPFARQMMGEVAEALINGTVSIVNVLNPCRIILGGGVIEGLPELVEQIDRGVREWALTGATESLEIVKSKLGSEAGIIGAAAMAMKLGP